MTELFCVADVSQGPNVLDWSSESSEIKESRK